MPYAGTNYPFAYFTMKTNLLCYFFTAAAATSYCPPRPANHTEQLVIFHEFVQKFYVDKNVKAAFTDHFNQTYIEHNANAPLGTLQDTITGLTGLFAISNFTIMHSTFSNSTGWVHFRQDTQGSEPEAIVDVLKFNGSCIVEHWDVEQARPTNPANPLALW